MTHYEKVFSRFLNKISSTEYANMKPDQLTQVLVEVMDAAIDYIQGEGLAMVNDLSQRRNEILRFTNDLSSGEIEAIALYMVGIWYDPIVNSLEHTSMFFGSKDEKWNNQKDHLTATSNIQDKYFRKGRKLFRDNYYKAKLGNKLEVED